MSPVRYTFLLLMFGLFEGTFSFTLAQTNFDTRPVRGFMPTADLVVSPVDTIDATDGRLHLQIPTASLPRGRANFGFDLDLVYDSHLYDVQVLGDQQLLTNADTTGGWTYNFKNYRLEGENKEISTCSGTLDQPYYRLRLGLPDGSLHLLHLADQPFRDDGFYKYNPAGKPDPLCTSLTPLTGVLRYYTTDGSFLKVEITADGTPDWWNKSWYLYYSDGRRAVGRGSQLEELWDANGNRIRFINYCRGEPPCDDLPSTTIAFDWDIDANGVAAPARSIQIDFNINGRTSETALVDRITMTGPKDTIVWLVNWQAIVIGGSNSGRTYTCSSSTPSTCDLDSTHWVISNIQVPKASSSAPQLTYDFQYSGNDQGGYGELRYMKTPSGARYSYEYRLEGSQPDPSPDTEDIVHFNSVKQKTITHDDATSTNVVDTWTYTFTDTNSTFMSPDGGSIVHSFYGRRNWTDAWSRGLVYRIDEPFGHVRKREWAQNKVSLATTAISNPNNPYIQKETVTLGNASGAPTRTGVISYLYDKNGNLLQKTEYDWVDYAGVPIENGQIIKRMTNLTYYAAVPVAASTPDCQNNPYPYWCQHFSGLSPYGSRRLDAILRRDVSDGTNVVSATEYVYDNAYTSGNVTTERRWDSVKSATVPATGQFNSANSQILTRSYDPYGNLTDIYPPEVHTHITYEAQGNVPIQVDYAYQTADQRSWSYGWNINDTAVTSKTELTNGNFATTYDYDNLGRTKSADEGGLRRTQTAYDDVARTVTVSRDLRLYGDAQLQTITSYDQLGRIDLVTTPDNIKVKTIDRIYPSGGGRRIVRSSPYRNLSNPTDPTLEWTCTQYDIAGRVIRIAMFKGSSPPVNNDCQTVSNRTGVTETSYDAQVTTITSITEPPSKVRQQKTDPLGRLTEVIEDPDALNYSTTYSYDPLDNLTGVLQGVQNRSFAYSSLNRLRSATNPESGTTTYFYHDTGDLKTRTDARGISVTFGYDDLHRLRTKDHSDDATKHTDYKYDNKGNLESVISGDASISYGGYDPLHRFHTQTEVIIGNANPYTLNYDYWLNDELKTMQYPSLKQISYSVDNAGRTDKVYSATKTYGDLTSQVVPNAYDPLGRIAKMKFGNELWETRDILPPGSATLLRLGTTNGANDRMELEYNYSATNNNGNLVSHTIRQPGKTWSQTYTYDNLNRIATASETNGFSQTFDCDRYGNCAVSTSNLSYPDIHEPISLSNFSSATNRLNVAGSVYDDAGNQTLFTPYTLIYDAENRIKAATSQNNGNAAFAYDGDSRRVKKVWTPNGGTTTTTYYIYDLYGRLAAEYSDQTPSTTGTSYVFTDLLGSVRAITGEKPDLNTPASIVECSDYLPFGRLLGSGDNGRNTGCFPSNPNQPASRLPQKFTGKERDGESGLDFFGARYLSAAQGRFTSPDPLPGWQNDPQSWNMYAYGRNNPLRYTDPDGQTYRVCETEDKNCGYITDEQFAAFRKTQSLRFVGGNKGSIYSGNTLTGTFKQTDVDLPRDVQMALYAAGVTADRELKNAIKDVAINVAGGAALSAAGVAITKITTIGVENLPLLRQVSKIVSNRNLRHIVNEGHLAEFQKLAPGTTLDDVVNMGVEVAQTGRQVGGRVFDRMMEVGGQWVTVRAVLNPNNAIRTVYILK